MLGLLTIVPLITEIYGAFNGNGNRIRTSYLRHEAKVKERKKEWQHK